MALFIIYIGSLTVSGMIGMNNISPLLFNTLMMPVVFRLFPTSPQQEKSPLHLE
ncbi:MAG: hypothetical protein IPN53_21175 [Comamonadaceae bacterium]|nr:hypothetical protein [Comamonadaceae bacterium]